MKIVFAVGIVTLIGLLGYLAYVQNTSQNKKIKTLNSSVVELQGQVKELQKQVNNSVSFGTQQSLDALIHQIESEIDNQTESGAAEPTSHVSQSGGMLMDDATDMVGNVENTENIENDELYQELENELTNVFESESETVMQNDETANVVLVEEEPFSLIDDELDGDTDEEDNEEDEDDEDDDDEEDDEDDDEDDEDDEGDEDDEDDDEEASEIEEENVADLQNEVEDDFMEKLNDFYLSKTQAELRSLCRKHKKPFSGNKQTLVTRILQVDKLRNVTLE